VQIREIGPGQCPIRDNLLLLLLFRKASIYGNETRQAQGPTYPSLWYLYLKSDLI